MNKRTFEQWLVETMLICKDVLSDEAVVTLNDMDDEKLGGMLFQGYYDESTPNEMAIIIAGSL